MLNYANKNINNNYKVLLSTVTKYPGVQTSWSNLQAIKGSKTTGVKQSSVECNLIPFFKKKKKEQKCLLFKKTHTKTKHINPSWILFYPKLRNILHRLLLQKAVTHCFKHKAENKMFIIHILCIIYVYIFMYKCTCAVRPYLHTYSNNTLYIHIVQNET